MRLDPSMPASSPARTVNEKTPALFSRRLNPLENRSEGTSVSAVGPRLDKPLHHVAGARRRPFKTRFRLFMASTISV